MSPRKIVAFGMLIAVAAVDAAPSTDLQKIMTVRAPAKKDEVSGYVFVSTRMNDGQLINLARQARNHNFTVVLNGFGENGIETQKRIAGINNACCDQAGPGWVIYPQLFRNFRIGEVPAFVLARGDSGAEGTYSKVVGAMAIPDALGIFANKSKFAFIRTAANRRYRDGITQWKK